MAPAERTRVERTTACSAVGATDAVRQKLAAIADATGADELVLSAPVYDHAALLRSFELAGRRPGVA